MSMVKMARFLGINRSLDGAAGGARWFDVPRSGAAPLRVLADRGQVNPAFLRRLESFYHDAAVIRHRASHHILF